MKQLELEFNFKAIPDAAKDPKNLQVFSKKERLDDLKENAKVHKKKSLVKIMAQTDDVAQLDKFLV